MLDNKKSTLSMKGSVDDILKMAYGGKSPGQNLADGGMTEGPSHEEGGVQVAEQGEAPVAEIEGGERVFSKEDTAAIEQSAEQIIQMTEAGDQKSADDMAMRLGYAIVKMVAAQEQNQQAQEQQMTARQEGGAPEEGAPAEPSEEEAAQMNEFGPVE